MTGCGVELGERTSEELLPLVYEELRKLAAARMAQEWETSTLQPTALVHEVWLRLTGSNSQGWKSKAQFFAAAAEAMRRILIDNARRKRAQKRGAGIKRIDLNQINIATEINADSLLLVNEALEKLAALDRECAELIRLRFYTGLRYEEAATVL